MWSILCCCRGMWLKRRKLCSSCFKVSRRELMLLERRVRMNEYEGFFTKNAYCWGSLFSTVDVSYLLLVGMSPFNLFTTHLCPSVWWPLVCFALCLAGFVAFWPLSSFCSFGLQLCWCRGILAFGHRHLFLNRFGSPLPFGCWHPSSLDMCLPRVLVAFLVLLPSLFLGIGWVGSAMCLWPLQLVSLVSLAYLLLLASWCLC